MDITGIKIRKVMDSGRLKGIVSVTFDEVFAVHDIKIVQGDKRLFVAMPSRRGVHVFPRHDLVREVLHAEFGEYRDIVHPITGEARTEIEERILEAFREESERRSMMQ